MKLLTSLTSLTSIFIKYLIIKYISIEKMGKKAGSCLLRLTSLTSPYFDFENFTTTKSAYFAKKKI